MAEHPIPNRDDRSFTQAKRRTLLLASVEEAHAWAQAKGMTTHHTEDPDGFTIYVNGFRYGRITYAMALAWEAEAQQRVQGET